MGIPLDILLVFLVIAIALFLMTLFLLFDEPTFGKTIIAIFLSFINSTFNFLTGLSFFGVDLFGFDASGELVSNPVYDFMMFGIFFIFLTYLCVLFLLYGIYLLYIQPWYEVERTYRKKKDPWYQNPDMVNR